MEKVITKDTSITYFNEQYQEHYHSTSGAREEAMKKFVEPIIPYIKHKDNLKLLDLCFGLGYNTAAAIDILAKGRKKISIIGLENDEGILQKITELHAEFDSFILLHALVKNKIHPYGYHLQTTFNDCLIDITLLIDDARTTIANLEDVDAVFFDPFSPKKCPELWTEEFFKEVQRSMKKGGALTTYSCAKTVRDTLRNLGFSVLNGPCVGRKAPSTIAIK
jgi:tRNA U34 5-methylaminomethyl-2-thiouridine-forming methyltransferase MnmC